MELKFLLNFKRYRVYIILLTLLFTFGANAGNLLNDFTDKVKGRCPAAGNLIVKKVLLNMVNHEKYNCEDVFFPKLKKDCPELECFLILSIFEKTRKEQQVAGSVIGGTR